MPTNGTEDPTILKLVRELHQAQSVAGYAKSNLEFMTVMCNLMAEEIAKNYKPDPTTPKAIIELFTINAYEKMKVGKT